MAYLLDTNVFIAAKNLHYGFDICPGFWSWLDQVGRAGIVGKWFLRVAVTGRLRTDVSDRPARDLT